MLKPQLKCFDKADEVRKIAKGRLEIIHLGGAIIGRAVLEPGWSWAESIQPLAGTKTCQAHHLQYHVSGVLRVRMDDGTEFDCNPGDMTMLPPGHIGWAVGDEPVVIIDFQGMAEYGKAVEAT